MKQKLLAVGVILSLAAIIANLSACSQSTPSATDQTAAMSNASVSSSPLGASANANTPPMAPAGNMGEPIDTSKHNAEIARLEKQAQKTPGDETTRTALAQAYLARANALKDARQYRVALGDYRRALRYDPDNEEAQQMAAVIVSIMTEMNRDVPAEGEEPAPLPITPDTSEDDEEATASPSTNKASSTRKGDSN